MKKEGFTLSFNAILIQDFKGGYTAYFKQFPNIVTEGENEDEALSNLFNALHDVMQFKSKTTTPPAEMDHLKVVERSVDFKALETA